MAKKQHWIEALSAPVKLLLMVRVEADGYGTDVEAWVRDVVATAVRSPQGYVLRFSKAKGPAKLETSPEAEDVDLFNSVPGGGAMTRWLLSVTMI